ncbi:MAG: imidazoleglycerol-phosphate dehydratase HisB [Deltaproteobacteria bacterium]|nr:imidazoleglycerol-phosphate dehydratase HisB [Deltaproteobacteria bacterium]
MNINRASTIDRKTSETDIRLSLNIDGAGKASLQTGVAFLDHMLTLFSVHGFFFFFVQATGDLDVDAHHTVEDVGICLGQAFKNALADFSAINRYGHCTLPMDETIARVTVDFSNRPYLHYDVVHCDQKVGTFDTALVREFLRALSLHGGMTLHVEVPYGQNTHHILEAVFKALGRTLDQATARNLRTQGPLSTKGSL